MSDELKEIIYKAVDREDGAAISKIVETFRGAGANYKDVFAVFKMACPWIDERDFEQLMQIAEEA